MQVLTWRIPATGVVDHFRFCNGVPLRRVEPRRVVDVLEYGESTPMERCSIHSIYPTFS